MCSYDLYLNYDTKLTSWPIYSDDNLIVIEIYAMLIMGWAQNNHLLCHRVCKKSITDRCRRICLSFRST